MAPQFFFEKKLKVKSVAADNKNRINLSDIESNQSTEQTVEKVTIKESRNISKKKQISQFTLVDAINRALSANRGLADAVDRVESVQFSIISSKAEFELKVLPSSRAGVANGDEDLGFELTLQQKFAAGTSVSVKPNINKTNDTYSTGVDTSLIQPLLKGFNKEFNLSSIHGG